MSSRYRSLATITTAAVIALALASCTGPAAPPAPPSESVAPSPPAEVEYAEITVGTCITGSVTDPVRNVTDPDLEAVVDCTLPHLYEVTGTMTVPATWIDASGTVEQIQAQRDALLREDGANRGEYLAYTEGFCEYMASVVAGIDVEIDGVSAGEAGLAPLGTFWIDRSLPTAERIAATGSVQLVCAVAFTDVDGKQIRMASSTGQALIFDFLSPDFPIELRACVAYAEPFPQPISCDQAHWIEPFAEIDATIFGDAFVDRVWDAFEAGEPPSREDDQLVADACRASFVGVADAGNPTETTKISARFEFDWTKLSGPRRPVSCIIVATDSENYDIIGSRVGVATGDAELVRVG